MGCNLFTSVKGFGVAAALSAAMALVSSCNNSTSRAISEDVTNTRVPNRTEVLRLLSPPQMLPAIVRKEPALVKVELETIEKVDTLANGVDYTFWTFGGSVPGPMLRVRQGDTVELTLKNSPTSKVCIP